MRRGLAIAGMMALPLLAVGCGEQGTEREAQVAGFDWTAQTEVEAPVWHAVNGAKQYPAGEYRDLHAYTETVCKPVENPSDYNYDTQTYDYADVPDDMGCMLEFDCDLFDSEEVHCEERKEPRYNYEALRWDVVATCEPGVEKAQAKPDQPRKDKKCIQAAYQDGYRTEHSDQQWVHVKYEITEKDGQIRHCVGSVAVASDEWVVVELGDTVDIREDDCKRVYDLDVK